MKRPDSDSWLLTFPCPGMRPKISGYMLKMDRIMLEYDELARQEYGDLYQGMKWITPEEALAAEEERDQLLASVSARIECEYADMKPHFMGLSPGCRLCGEGSWSCLFINNICNAGCFYCPASQKVKGEPSTNTIVFTRPEDYVEYLRYFRFRGASISGGEPLMTLDRTLSFISKIKRHFGKDLYLWLYTNGILLTESIIGRLKDAGLDEIRFDLSAVNYSLDKLKLALGRIPNVTVEIPAIPEDEAVLQKLVFKLEGAGVSYLNLHKLRCTVYNCSKMVKRRYTLLHGENVTVLESELAALRILKFVIDNQLALPVNYCSFDYKYHFQSLAARKRTAKLIVKPHEDITRASFIRSLSIRINREKANSVIESLKSQGLDENTFCFNSSKERLYLNERTWNKLELNNHPVFLSYFKTAMVPRISYHYPYKTLQINPRKIVVIERRPVILEKEIFPDIVPLFRKILNGLVESDDTLDAISDRFDRCKKNDPVKMEPITTLLKYEHIRKGLSDYF
ncbi:MAG: radical SAM protein [bacterium]